MEEGRVGGDSVTVVDGPSEALASQVRVRFQPQHPSSTPTNVDTTASSILSPATIIRPTPTPTTTTNTKPSAPTPSGREAADYRAAGISLFPPLRIHHTRCLSEISDPKSEKRGKHQRSTSSASKKHLSSARSSLSRAASLFLPRAPSPKEAQQALQRHTNNSSSFQDKQPSMLLSSMLEESAARTGTGKLVVELELPAALYSRLPPVLWSRGEREAAGGREGEEPGEVRGAEQERVLIDVHAVLINQGVNEMQSLANSLGNYCYYIL